MVSYKALNTTEKVSNNSVLVFIIPFYAPKVQVRFFTVAYTVV